MNCKPGDLAFLVGSDYPENIGRVVTVVKWDAVDLEWLCEAGPMRAAQLEDGMYVRDFDFPGGLIGIPGEDLRPIRPGDITDEEVRDLYASNPLQIGQSLHEGVA